MLSAKFGLAYPSVTSSSFLYKSKDYEDYYQ